MEKIYLVVKLMAKTGVFFANADGIYLDKEKKYIDNFVSGIEQIGDITPELKGEIYGVLNDKHTLNEVITDTKELLDGFCEEERQAILKAIKGFINKVIRVDGHVHPLEKENYKLWKQAFGLS
jgi:hypothetical protein